MLLMISLVWLVSELFNFTSSKVSSNFSYLFSSAPPPSPRPLETREISPLSPRHDPWAAKLTQRLVWLLDSWFDPFPQEDLSISVEGGFQHQSRQKLKTKCTRKLSQILKSHKLNENSCLHDISYAVQAATANTQWRHFILLFFLEERYKNAPLSLVWEQLAPLYKDNDLCYEIRNECFRAVIQKLEPFIGALRQFSSFVEKFRSLQRESYPFQLKALFTVLGAKESHLENGDLTEEGKIYMEGLEWVQHIDPLRSNQENIKTLRQFLSWTEGDYHDCLQKSNDPKVLSELWEVSDLDSLSSCSTKLKDALLQFSSVLPGNLPYSMRETLFYKDEFDPFIEKAHALFSEISEKFDQWLNSSTTGPKNRAALARPEGEQEESDSH